MKNSNKKAISANVKDVMAENSTMGADIIYQLKNNKDAFNWQKEMIVFAICKSWKTGKMADCHPDNPLFKVKVSKDFMSIQLFCDKYCVCGFDFDQQYFEFIESPYDLETTILVMAEKFTEKIIEMGIDAIEHACGLKNVA